MSVWQNDQDIAPTYELEEVWVHITGVPHAYRHLGMKTVGNDRKKPQLFSVSHFFSETISITVLTETNTVPIIRELRKRNYPIENSSISVENR